MEPSGGHGAPRIPPGGAHVTSQERAAAVAKLQTFLMAVVGAGDDALLRAAELANKFEQHVFTSTTTREEYLRVIVTRMQQVQQRRRSLSEEIHNSMNAGGNGGSTMHHHQSQQQPPYQQQQQTHYAQQSLAAQTSNPQRATTGTMTRESSSEAANGKLLELNETEKLIVRQKITKLASLIPRIDSILNSVPVGSEIQKKLQALKAVVERQAGLLARNAFIFSATTAAALLDQLQGILKQSGVSIGIENQKNDGGLDESERRLLHWQKSRRRRGEAGHDAEELTFTMPVSITQLDRGFINSNHTMTLLGEEISWLRSIHPDLQIICQAERWGYDLLVKIKNEHIISTQLPLEYPSERIYIQAHGVASNFVRDFQMGAFKVFTPISLSAIIKIIYHRLTLHDS